MSSSKLSVFFRPSGVAVIGASRDPQKLGHGVVRNLQNVRYEGPVYPINPHEEEILGYTAYASVKDVPDPVDLAVISVPAPAVVKQVEECGKRGIKGVIVVSGGFRETGPEGAAREREILAIAKQYDMRVIGPNCIGTIDAHTPLNTTFVVGMPKPGDIAFLSQSGAMAAAVMDWAVGSGVGFSRIVSLGNQIDVTEADMLETIGCGGKTKVVTGYIEGTSNGQAFLRSATKAAAERPVIFLKAGRGSSGAKAVASHTGALAGDLAAYEAAFRRSGVLWANTMEELFDWGRALAWQPLPKGKRVALLTNAGGPAILAADALEEMGMELAPLTPETKAFLRKRVFAAASVENPVDILAGAGPATYALCLDALLADETVDAVVVIQAPQDWFSPLSLAEVIGEVANSSLGREKPILSVIMGLASTSEATHVLHRRHIPNFAFPERIGSTLAAMLRRKHWLDDRSQNGDAPLVGIDRDAVETVLANEPNGWLRSDLVDQLLNLYSIPTPKSDIATSPEEAARMAEDLGFPLVMKLVSPDITHKTDVGGVVLNVRSAQEASDQFTAIYARVKSVAPNARVGGIMLQQMITEGVELITGAIRDPQFGPLVMAGSGGTQVELKRDVAFELAPVQVRTANEMLGRTAASRLLQGFRGKPAMDVNAATDILMRISRLIEDHPSIQEIEINPVVVRQQGAVALDARVKIGR